jgi:lipopolysaccharide heptosyltransferase II
MRSNDMSLIEDIGWTAANLVFRGAASLQRRLFETPRRILVIKLCCVGDVLLATPALAALRRAYPQAHIAWAVSTWALPLLENNPHLDDLIDAGTVGTRAQTSTDLRRLERRVRQGNYDTCLVLDRSPRLTTFAWRAGIPQRIGLNSRGRGFAHSVQVPVRGIRHEAELYLDVLRAMDVPVENARLEFYPSQPDQEQVAQLLNAAMPSRLYTTNPLVVLHPGGGENPGMEMQLKRWPAERFALLANRLVREHNARLVLVGGAGDVTISRDIAGLIAYPVTNLTGELSWGQLGALLAWTDLYVGNDTGATHLAVAMGARVVAIFGPTDPRRYGPFAPPEQAIALWHPISALREGVSAGAPPGFSWERGVSVDEAAEAAGYLLQPHRQPARA